MHRYVRLYEDKSLLQEHIDEVAGIIKNFLATRNIVPGGKNIGGRLDLYPPNLIHDVKNFVLPLLDADMKEAGVQNYKDMLNFYIKNDTDQLRFWNTLKKEEKDAVVEFFNALKTSGAKELVPAEKAKKMMPHPERY